MAIGPIVRVINGTAKYENFLGTTSAEEYRMTVNFGVNDLVDGGGGIDTLSYVNADRGVKVTMANGSKSGITESAFATAQGTNPFSGPPVQIETKVVTQFKNFENVTGSSFNDTITGNSTANRIDGGAGADTINGGDGADVIIGGKGADKLYGGEGADTFAFLSFLDSTSFNALSSQTNASSAGMGLDLIDDFRVGSDKIDLSAIDANSAVDGNQAFRYVEDFTGQAGELRMTEFSRGPTIDTPGMFFTSVQGDIDGDGTGDFAIVVLTPFSLDSMTAGDLIL